MTVVKENVLSNTMIIDSLQAQLAELQQRVGVRDVGSARQESTHEEWLQHLEDRIEADARRHEEARKRAEEVRKRADSETVLLGNLSSAVCRLPSHLPSPHALVQPGAWLIWRTS
jgi:hypothetical protein